VKSKMEAMEEAIPLEAEIGENLGKYSSIHGLQ
jgi:hypothetical protein